MTGAEVVAEHVRKTFEGGRIRALEDVSIRLEPGEFVALTGPSGCGKSTLLNLLGALDRPDAGELRVAGQNLGRLEDASAYRATTVGFVFQFHNLIPTLSALENVQVPMIGRGSDRRARQERARRLLAEVGLGERERSRPPTLSGGERQRVAIARALAAQPDLLVCDEVTSALDVSVQAAVLELLQELQRGLFLSMFFITHDLGVVACIADSVLVMDRGSICETGPVHTVLSAPTHEYTRRLLQAAPRLTERAVGVERDRVVTAPRKNP